MKKLVKEFVPETGSPKTSPWRRSHLLPGGFSTVVPAVPLATVFGLVALATVTIAGRALAFLWARGKWHRLLS